MKLFNTLGRSLVELAPLEAGHVRLYTCGPTVYNVPHVGNLRTFVFEDVLRRHLRARGLRVTQIMNLTDVDDKTIRGAAQARLSLNDFTAQYIEAFFRDIATLNLEKAERYPRATEHIPEMIVLIERLRERGHTYESDGSVYFRIASFEGYGKLSGIDLSQTRRGERVADDEYEKEDVKDFVLWKAGKPGEPSWPSPFGPGRPGWHIECSAMSMKYLGERFDIHTGAVDNIFPHHENEIAQSEGATGKPFVDIWLHAEHLIVDGEKMSKSKGNFYTLADVLARRDDPAAVRYLFLSVPYRKKLNFTWEGLAGAAAAVDRLRSAAARLDEVAASGKSVAGEFPSSERSARLREEFTAAMDDDLNTAGAQGALFTFLREVNVAIDEGTLGADGAAEAKAALAWADRVFGVLPEAPEALPEEIEARIEARNAARKRRDFAE
ncbi:MAG: cysteine--tRNA ligase, partial [Thermoanaerobaculia bacterium]